MKKTIFFLIIAMGAMSVEANAQGKVAIKTNALHWATLTPNLGVEIGLGTGSVFARRSSLDLYTGYNPWKLKGTDGNNKKLAHIVAIPEYRYWLCERFNGHFFGLHLFYAGFNISGHKIPLLFDRSFKGFPADKLRNDGNMYGAGVSYGYQFILSRRLNLEFTLGVGYARMVYDVYDYERCGEKLGKRTHNYFGPTKIGISLVFVID